MADDLDEEEKEDNVDDFLLTKTGILCTECEEHIHIGEEVFEAQIVFADLLDGTPQYRHVLDEHGDAVYEAKYFEFNCWESVEEDLNEIVEDAPPMRDAYGLIGCDICGSDIREYEVFALVRFGEIHSSKKSPDGLHTICFVNMGRDKHICVACIYNGDDRLWEEEIEPRPGEPVCWEGIHSRCWRSNCNKTTCKSQTEE